MSFGIGGGGRGGRGGIGGGGGGGGAGMGMTRSGAQIPMGTMTWADLAEVDKKKPSKSYPVMEERPILSPPSRMETRIIQNQLHFLQNQKETPWWPTEEDKNRKRDGVIRYSDQFQKDSIENNRSGLSLKDDDLINTLQKEAFPAGLWNLYMTAESKRQEKEKKREEQKRGADWHRVIETFEVRDEEKTSGSKRKVLSDLNPDSLILPLPSFFLTAEW